jgi:hypothetical protein
MNEISISVRLKAPDPAAMTALSTFRRINPDICPECLERFDHWSFIDPGNGRKTVSEIVSRYHDIVNPNKQIWSFEANPYDGISSADGGMMIDVLVTDRIDSISENWTAILRRSNCDVKSVRYSVLWRFGFASDVPVGEAKDRVMRMTLSTHRDRGLLANPVSQKINLPAFQ